MSTLSFGELVAKHVEENAATFDEINVSIDIETTSENIPNAAVLSIGVVADNGTQMHEYLNIEEQFLQLNRTASGKCLEFWLKDENIQLFKTHVTYALQGHYAQSMLDRLQHYFKELYMQVDANSKINVWMNSPSFDGVILLDLAHQFNRELPWSFRQERDVRTIKKLVQSREDSDNLHWPAYPDNAHDALVDARYQLEVVHFCKTILNC